MFYNRSVVTYGCDESMARRVECVTRVLDVWCGAAALSPAIRTRRVGSMELSATLFETTVRAIKGDEVPIGPDRRSAPRVGLRCRARVFLYDKGVLGESMSVWTRDLSREGIGLMCGRKMEVGDRLVLPLPRPGHSRPLVLLCTVGHCTPIATGMYAVGTSFVEVSAHHAIPAPAVAAHHAGEAESHSEDYEHRISASILS
jgi:hypothetical protein